MLGALTGVDPADPITKESDGKVPADYTKFLDPKGLHGKRIGIEKSMLKGHEGVDRLLDEALAIMKSNGATIVEVDLLGKLNDIDSSEYAVLQFEFKDGLNRYLSSANARMKTLKDIIAFNKENEATAMPYFKQEILESSEAKGGLDSREYLDALKKILSATRNTLDGVMKENQLSAICGPTNGPTWCTDLVNGDFFTGYGVYSSAAIAGYPHITIPMGLVFELPIGLSFLGLPYSEPELITIGYAYEQLSKKRVPPSFKKSSAS